MSSRSYRGCRSARTRGIAAIGLLWSTIAAAALLSQAAAAQQADEDELRPGLVATYRGAGETTAQRVERRLSFDWGNRPPDRRLALGPFQARWRGLLMSQGTGAYRLHAYVDGQVTLKLAGKTLLDAATDRPEWRVSEAVELAFDWHPLEIEFASAGKHARLSLFWSGPGFGLEPLSPARLFHEPSETPSREFEHGETLARAFRCAACHQVPGESALPAPALDHLAGQMRSSWLAEWLRASHADHAEEAKEAEPLDATVRRMPRFVMTGEDSRALAAYLLAGAAAPDPAHDPAPAAESGNSQSPVRAKSKSNPKKQDKPPGPDASAGRDLLVTLGCLACHQLESLGTRGVWSGGDLTAIAGKRPASFFSAWLADPARLNRDHRMPRYDLNERERADLAAFLATCNAAPAKPAENQDQASTPEPSATSNREASLPAALPAAARIAQGRQLFERHRCHACHQGPADAARRPIPRMPLRLTHGAGLSNGEGKASGEGSCLTAPGGADRPYYPLTEEDRQALTRFLSEAGPRTPPHEEAQALIEQKNCFACHARGVAEGLAERVTKIGKRFPRLAPSAPAMTPPSLESVGDKLRDETLRDAIERRGPPHRPWLMVRMPRYELSERERERLAGYFVTSDRIPDRPDDQVPDVSEAVVRSLGGRLVTSGGFGCTSCHAVGSVVPPKAPLNALGPDLSQLGRRIRYPWFDRWVRDPARIVPRMEMPSVKLPVSGVLEQNLDQQLATVWHALNQPGFEPPEPNPVRIVRQSGQRPDGRAELITDVVRLRNDKVYIKPLLIGLPNRHNVLYDLAEARLAEWSIGDTARQRTQGKTWFWEMAGAPAAPLRFAESEWRLSDGERTLAPRRDGQFLTEFDSYRHRPGGITFRHRLEFADSEAQSEEAESEEAESEEAPRWSLAVEQTFEVPPAAAERGIATGFDRRLTVGAPRPVAGTQQPTGQPSSTGQPGHRPRVRLRLLPEELLPEASFAADRRSVSLPGVEGVRIRVAEPEGATIDRQGFVELPWNESARNESAGGESTASVSLEYRCALPVDRYPAVAPPEQPLEPQPLDAVPGWRATRLPLTNEIMPTSLAWRPDGSLVFTSLKGRVWLARDLNDDGLEDRLSCFSDELAAPFGLAAGPGYLDVINKYALLRLYDDDQDHRADRVRTLASGWGHTTDYHDWAVGLPRDSAGGYYMATACQQDQRDPAAARWRGRVMHLVPRSAAADEPHAFDVRVVSEGHRFPIGIARNRAGDLFVTDNQGNYNPFNELNHVVPGAHYGFLNALERRPGYDPPLTPPAINIPHPWTRSVNGICFLETPPALRKETGRDAFGPWEGQLVGCEYDTRRLIRLSLERVGDTFQGAAYPLSYDEPPAGESLVGPLACAVSPRGDLYVGCIRDSGWGGANNIGSIVRLRPDPAGLPAGLTEVRATSSGFRLLFSQPVDRRLAAAADNYSVVSYTRVATPAYGGPDQNRRKETVREIKVRDDLREVRLELKELRAGYVYEIRLKPLVPAGELFFPAEAHYSLQRIP